VRVANRVLAAAFALALLLAALLVVAEVVAAVFATRPWLVPYDEWYREAQRTTWDSALARGVSAGLAVVGLVLVVAQVAPRRPRDLPLAHRPGGAPAEVGRRSVERSVDRAVMAVDGVAGVEVRAARRAVRVRAQSSWRVPGDQESKVREAVAGRLGELGVAERLGIEVSVSARDGR
jgi:hypothetical protein